MKKIALYSMSLAAALCAQKVDVKAKDSVSGLYVGVGGSFSGMFDPFVKCNMDNALFQGQADADNDVKAYVMEHLISTAGLDIALAQQFGKILASAEFVLGWGMNAHGKNVYATSDGDLQNVQYITAQKDGKSVVDYAIVKHADCVSGRAKENAFAVSGKISIGYSIIKDGYVALFYRCNALVGNGGQYHNKIAKAAAPQQTPAQGTSAVANTSQQAQNTGAGAQPAQKVEMKDKMAYLPTGKNANLPKIGAQVIHVVGLEYIHHFGPVAAKLGAGFALGNGEVGMAKGFDAGVSLSYKVM